MFIDVTSLGRNEIEVKRQLELQKQRRLEEQKLYYEKQIEEQKCKYEQELALLKSTNELQLIQLRKDMEAQLGTKVKLEKQKEHLQQVAEENHLPSVKSALETQQEISF